MEWFPHELLNGIARFSAFGGMRDRIKAYGLPDAPCHFHRRRARHHDGDRSPGRLKKADR